MGGGTAQVQPGHWGAGGEAALPHLVGQAVALEDVAAGEPDPRLDVGRTEHLPLLDAVEEVGGEPGHLREKTLDELRDNLKEVVELCLEEMDPETKKQIPEFVGIQQLEVTG